MNVFFKWYIFCLIQDQIEMQTVQLYVQKYGTKDKSVTLNCSSDKVPEGDTAEFLVNGKSVNNVRLHKTKCFQTVNVMECIPGVCQCSGDGRTMVFYYYPKNTGKYDFSCRMKFTSNITSQGHFVTKNKVTNIIESTPLIKTDTDDYSINLTCFVEFLEITTIFTWSCDDESITAESFHNTSTSWSVVRLDLSNKESTTLCVCNVSLPTLDFEGSASTQLKYRGRPEILDNEVVYFGTDVVFTSTFYSSEESNIITWYRKWIRLVNSTDQVQSIKSTTINLLVRGKNVSVEGYKSSLVLRSAKENHLYNIRICVKNYYGISCHRYLESEEKDMLQTKPIIWVIAVVTVIVCSAAFVLLFYRQRSATSIPTESTRNPVYYSVDNQQNNAYQPILAERNDSHSYEIPNAVYEHLIEERPLHDYNTPSRYEEPYHELEDTNSIERRENYEKID